MRITPSSCKSSASFSEIAQHLVWLSTQSRFLCVDNFIEGQRKRRNNSILVLGMICQQQNTRRIGFLLLLQHRKLKQSDPKMRCNDFQKDWLYCSSSSTQEKTREARLFIVWDLLPNVMEWQRMRTQQFICRYNTRIYSRYPWQVFILLKSRRTISTR
jgi:hypothetical protein